MAAGAAGMAAGEGLRRRATRPRGGPRVASAPEATNSNNRVIYLDDVTKRMNEYVPEPRVCICTLANPLYSGPGAENSPTTTPTSSLSATSSISFANGWRLQRHSFANTRRSSTLG